MSREWWVVGGGFRNVARRSKNFARVTRFVIRRRRTIWRLATSRLVVRRIVLFWLPPSVFRLPSLRVWRLASGVLRLLERAARYSYAPRYFSP
jgi:hypothetical protein